MIKNNDPYLIEYNVRMGDPECQTILPLLENDFAGLINKCIEGDLINEEIKWKIKKVFVLSLPQRISDDYKKNVLIKNLENYENSENQYIPWEQNFMRKIFFNWMKSIKFCLT